jgi:hypothetical protein
MRFWIDTVQGDNYESFETEGHSKTHLSAHLDAMKIADAWGYSNGYLLKTEDGFEYEVVDPYRTKKWIDLMNLDYEDILKSAS